LSQVRTAALVALIVLLHALQLPAAATPAAPVVPTSRVAASDSCLHLGLVGTARRPSSEPMFFKGLDVAADGNFAVVVDGDWAFIVDLTNPGDPVSGAAAYMPAARQVVGVVGRRAIVLGWKVLQVLDFEQLEAPGVAEVTLAEGTMNVRSAAMIDDENIAVLGSYQAMPAAAAVDGLLMLTVRDPAAGRVNAALALPDAQAIAVHGGAAYVVSGDRLLIVDLRAAVRPAVVGQVDLPIAGIVGERTVGVLAGDGFAVVQVGWQLPGGPVKFWSKILIVDVGDPPTPRVVGVLPLDATPPPPMSSLGASLVLSGYHMDWALDLSKPAAPTLLPTRLPRAGLDHLLQFHGLMHQGRLLVTDSSELLRIFDVRRDTPCHAPPVTGDPAGPRPSAAKLWLPMVLSREPRQAPPVREASPVGQYGGEVVSAALGRGTAFLGVGSGLAVLDVADPARPRPLGLRLPLPGIARHLVLLGDTLLAVTGQGVVQALDVTDPGAPRPVAQVQVPDGVEAVLATPGRLFVVGYQQVTEVDVTRPTMPRVVATVLPPTWLAVYGVAAGRLYALGTDGTWQYDPVTGASRGSTDVTFPERPTAVAGTDRRLYVASAHALYVLDVTGPAGPRLVTRIPAALEQLTTDGDTLYGVLAYPQGVVAYSLADPDRPSRLAEFKLQYASSILAASAGRLIVASYPGVRLVDLSVPEHPRASGSLLDEQPTYRLVARDDVGYLRAGPFYSATWRVMDVTRPEAVTDLGPLLPEDHGTQDGDDLFERGDTLYASARVGPEAAAVVDVLDAGNPRQPRLVSSLPLSATSDIVTLSGDDENLYVWTADDVDPVDRLTVVDPTRAPPDHLRGSLDVHLWAPAQRAMVARAGLVYAAAAGGLAIVDARDPDSPRLLRQMDLAQTVFALRIDGDRLYALARPLDDEPDTRGGRLLIFDLATPESPRLLSQVTAGVTIPGSFGPSSDLAVAGGLAAAGVYPNGIDVLDVSDAMAPRRLAGWTADGDLGAPVGVQVAIAGERLLAATERGGLIMYDLRAEVPARPRPPNLAQGRHGHHRLMYVPW
jgi:hypothetical protein